MTSKKSVDVVRCCEKCKSDSLLLTGEVKGNYSYNFIIRVDSGVIAERWSCQNCDYYFQNSLEKPNSGTVGIVIGIIVAGIGFLGVVISAIQYFTNTTKNDFYFTLIYCSILIPIGMIVIKYGLRVKNILKRNPIVDGLIPIPFENRNINLPKDRKPRTCKCGGAMNCIADTKKSFNMIPTGSIYKFKCSSCDKTVTIESIWRTTLFCFIAIIGILMSYPLLDLTDINTKGNYILVGILITSIVILGIRLYRLAINFGFKKFTNIE